MIDCSLSRVAAVLSIAQKASDAIVEIYTQYTQNNRPEIIRKEDNSPVTQADLLAHQIIVQGLTQLQPQFPILSEESTACDYLTRRQWESYWLVDPLDGTREFLAHNGEFTVNIALIHQGKPVIGVVIAPVSQTAYFASQDIGAFKQQHNLPAVPIKTRQFDSNHIIVTTSRHHGSTSEKMTSFLNTYFSHYQLINLGSSLKFCQIAEGIADFYPRLGPTSEWDTAAAQCILEQAGGILVDFNQQPLRYNQKESLLNPEFLAAGDKAMLEILQKG